MFLLRVKGGRFFGAKSYKTGGELFLTKISRNEAFFMFFAYPEVR
jgi:hypothetical protein